MTRVVKIQNMEAAETERDIVVSCCDPTGKYHDNITVLAPCRETVLSVHENQILKISDRMPSDENSLETVTVAKKTPAKAKTTKRKPAAKKPAAKKPAAKKPAAKKPAARKSAAKPKA